jgi:O-succinylbenzoic acid--CoA ligase
MGSNLTSAAVPRLIPLDATGDLGFVDALQRAWDDGDAVLPVDPRLPAPARERVLATARVHEPVEPGDALVIATSGTTGDPKAAVLTREAVAASALATSARLAVDPTTDRWLACLPLAHVGGLGVITRALLTGTALEVHDGFDAARAEAAARAGATLVSLVPTALSRIDASVFRVVVLGGSAPPVARPGNVIATYGMTETGGGIVYDGVPLDGVELRTSDEGEIEVRAPMVLRCYRDGIDPKTADGWLPTGDLGEVTAGVLHVHGRRGDLIITGGENVWPAAVERAIVTHAAVREVAIVGRPDEDWGTRVVAIVVPMDRSSPPSLDDLRAHVKEQLPAFAAPRELQLVDELPRTSLGKVRRGVL